MLSSVLKTCKLSLKDGQKKQIACFTIFSIYDLKSTTLKELAFHCLMVVSNTHRK